MTILDVHAVDLVVETRRLLIVALTKLKFGAAEGPEGPPVTLTPAEAAVIFRTLKQKGVTI